VLRRLGARAGRVDSHDTAALGRPALRTRLVRATFVVVALALLAAAVASARDLDTRERGLLPSRSTAVVVLDLSLSITDDDYNRVRAVLRRLVEEDAPVGLVIFSDIPYELLPPGTPASEMRPMLRLLVPPRLGPPVNPWVGTFRAGTRISAALDLARAMLERDEVERGSIFLISDLETAPDDIPQLTSTIADLRRADVDFRVVALSPSSDSRTLFSGLLQADAFVAPLDSTDVDPVSSDARTGVPGGLLALGGILFLVLALHERFGGLLFLPRPERAR
jgi:hypothetical protein